jgi:predicted GTPase
MEDLLPALGYGQEQMKELEETIARVECDSVIIATPIDLARFIRIDKPHTRVKYDLSPAAKEELRALMKARKLI